MTTTPQDHRAAAAVPQRAVTGSFLEGLAAQDAAEPGGARQVEVWAVLRMFGRQGVTNPIERHRDHAQAMAAHPRRAGLEMLNDVVLNQVLVPAATGALTLALVDAVQQDGTCWCGPTTWQHRPAMRISVPGWATSGEDIPKSAEAIIAAAGRQAGKGKAFQRQQLNAGHLVANADLGAPCRCGSRSVRTPPRSVSECSLVPGAPRWRPGAGGTSLAVRYRHSPYLSPASHAQK